VSASLQLQAVDGAEIEIERIGDVGPDGSARLRIIRWEATKPGRYSGSVVTVSGEHLAALIAKAGAKKAVRP
jgi:hypothetical protein